MRTWYPIVSVHIGFLYTMSGVLGMEGVCNICTERMVGIVWVGNSDTNEANKHEKNWLTSLLLFLSVTWSKVCAMIVHPNTFHFSLLTLKTQRTSWTITVIGQVQVYHILLLLFSEMLVELEIHWNQHSTMWNLARWISRSILSRSTDKLYHQTLLTKG